MISTESYLLFVSASLLLCLVPGPDMIYLLSRSLAQGRRAGIAAAIGINVGGYFHLLAAILGLSAILATSSTAFTLVKWAGALYLIYLGLQVLRRESKAVSIYGGGLTRQSLKTIFWQGFVSDVLNPKVALFFLALLPQFVDTSGGNPVVQLLILGLTVNVIAILVNLSLVYIAASLSIRLRRNQSISLWLNRVMGTIFMSLGLLSLMKQKL